MSISIPLELGKGGFAQASNVKQAINESLRLLLNTTCGEFVADPDYGFILNNLRFEIFDEKGGVIYNSQKRATDKVELYDKKIQGTSKSINTFAIDVKNAILMYEKRIQNIEVAMYYEKMYRRIKVEVKAIIKETLEPYTFTTYIHVWNR